MSLMKTPEVRVLLNPNAGAGAALRRLGEVREALRSFELEHDVVETAGPGDASRLAREAHRDGVKVLAVMGGDGTLNEVSQAYADADGNAIEGPDLAVIPAGTGGDYKRTLGLGGAVREAVGRIRHGKVRAFDLGYLRVHDHQRTPISRVFINITSFGVGGVTDMLVNEAPKWLGGKASFFIGSARALLQYRNVATRVRVDGVTLVDEPIFNVAVCLGRFFGGGMKIAPHAEPDDGLFDVVALGDLSKVEVLGLSSKIYEGSHLGSRAVYTARGKTVEAEPVHPWSKVLLDMDGETPGMLPLKATVLPGAIRVRT
jgi:diacylglycerol kinase (ATP)